MGQLMRHGVGCKSRSVVLCVVLLLALADCAMAEPSAQNTYEGFAERLVATERLWYGGAAWKELWSAPEFDALASEAPAHVDDCIESLADPNYTNRQKLFAIHTMYKTPLRDYLVFVRKLLDLVDRGYVPKAHLLHAVFPMTNIIANGALACHL